MFRSRMAASHDYTKIARLCKRAVGKHDYVLPILKEVINDGHLFLAFDKSNLIGMVNFTELIDNSGWLGMARTDPDWRGRGVAGFLQNAVTLYAKRKGISKLRMFILKTNTPSLRAAHKGGFKKVCEVSYVYRNTKKSIPQLHAFTRELSVRAFLRSEYVTRLNHYAIDQWHIIKANNDTAKRILGQGAVYSVGKTILLFSKTDDPDEHIRAFAILDGTLGRGLKQATAVASKLDMKSIGTFLPFGKNTINVAKKAGFIPSSWGWHMFVFEKKI